MALTVQSGTDYPVVAYQDVNLGSKGTVAIISPGPSFTHTHTHTDIHQMASCLGFVLARLVCHIDFALSFLGLSLSLHTRTHTHARTRARARSGVGLLDVVEFACGQSAFTAGTVFDLDVKVRVNLARSLSLSSLLIATPLSVKLHVLDVHTVTTTLGTVQSTVAMGHI